MSDPTSDQVLIDGIERAQATGRRQHVEWAGQVWTCHPDGNCTTGRQPRKAQRIDPAVNGERIAAHRAAGRNRVERYLNSKRY